MTSVVVDSILVINTGSSSVKFQLFERQAELQLLASGKVANLGSAPVFTATDETVGQLNNLIDQKSLPSTYTQENALEHILDWIDSRHGNWQIQAVAHRVVHGGTIFTKSIEINSPVLEQLWQLSPLAPLHQPHNLMGIQIISTLMPTVPQIACFDTAFHAKRDALFSTYALPEKMRDEGIRRFGFHGLSYEWIVHILRQNEPDLAKGRIIGAHLGNGASLCAMHNGLSIDTTMGMTALEGLPMGTRCGNLDPGAVIYMIRNLGLSPDEVEHMLYNQAGLLGLSGWTNDVKFLEDSDDRKAQFALDYFCLRGAQLMGMMAVAMKGLDGIVFTGGIGENSALVREKMLQRLEFLNPFEIRIIPANEERIIAMHTLALLAQKTE